MGAIVSIETSLPFYFTLLIPSGRNGRNGALGPKLHENIETKSMNSSSAARGHKTE